jgi:low affinity Fe/Cu permease
MSAEGPPAGPPAGTRCSCHPRYRSVGAPERRDRPGSAGLEGSAPVADPQPSAGAAPEERHAGLDDGDAAVVVARARRRNWRQRAWSSRVLHRLGQLTAHAGAGLLVAGVVVGWLIVGVVIDFPGWWENALYIASSLTTLIMVFAVQHTQARQAAATQRKLDELLRAIPTADNQLIALEDVSEQHLQQLNHRNIIDRETAPPSAPTGSQGAGQL